MTNDVRFPARVGRRLLEVARSAARTIRRSRPGVWLWRSNLSHQYHRGPSAVVDWQHRMAIYDMATGEERRRSVIALTDLFFEVVRGAGVARLVEAGAKDAQASLRAAASGVGTVIAYEANPYTYRRFASAVSASGVSYLPLALGERDGHDTFLVRLNENGSPVADGQGSLLERPDYVPGYERVDVDVVTLDGHLDAPDGIRTALWIDVEGAVAQVLRGAPALLSDVDVVMVEVEEHSVWTGQEWHRADVVDALATAGLVPLARDRQSRYQFNIVFTRPEILRTEWLDRARRDWRRAL